MTNYKCHKCGSKSQKGGMCCNAAMEKCCGVCGSAFDFCSCSGGSTKEPRARH